MCKNETLDDFTSLEKRASKRIKDDRKSSFVNFGDNNNTNTLVKRCTQAQSSLRGKIIQHYKSLLLSKIFNLFYHCVTGLEIIAVQWLDMMISQVNLTQLFKKT
jgi:hypothetical protein